MNHREFDDLCSEYERQLNARGVEAETVTEFFQYCRKINTKELDDKLNKTIIGE